MHQCRRPESAKETVSSQSWLITRSQHDLRSRRHRRFLWSTHDRTMTEYRPSPFQRSLFFTWREKNPRDRRPFHTTQLNSKSSPNSPVEKLSHAICLPTLPKTFVPSRKSSASSRQLTDMLAHDFRERNPTASLCLCSRSRPCAPGFAPRLTSSVKPLLAQPRLPPSLCKIQPFIC